MSKKIEFKYFIIALIVLFIGLLLTFYTKEKVVNNYKDIQYKASELMQKCENEITQYLIENNIEFEVEDINKIGLIGPEWSELTTTPGNEEAKRTSLNPEFAAAMVSYLINAGVKKGDTIAIGSSGSFPGLLIAVLCASEVMNLNVNLILSFGSSMFGATRVNFNISDIANFLKNKGYIDFNMLAVSPGGNNDYGIGILEDILYKDTRLTVLNLCKDEGVEVIDYNNIENSIQRRLELYGESPSLFVNIGGAAANLGESAYTLDFPRGLVLNPPRIPTSKNRGLTYEYASRGLPVLNLLDVRDLANENGIKYDPHPLPSIEKGDVYFSTKYNKLIIILSIIIPITIILIGYIKTEEEAVDETKFLNLLESSS